MRCPCGQDIWRGVARLPVNDTIASFSAVMSHLLKLLAVWAVKLLNQIIVTELSSPEWPWSPPGRFFCCCCSSSQEWAEPRSGPPSWTWPTASAASFPASAARQTTVESSTQWCLMLGALGLASMSTPSSRVTQVQSQLLSTLRRVK